MRWETGDQIAKANVQSLATEQLVAAQAHQLSHENKSCSVLENNPAPSRDYSEILARATHDAVRDWDVKTGSLTWPQGLQSLLGFSPDAVPAEIGFWEKRIHSDDVVRVVRSLREAISSGAEDWDCEYRLGRADGNYIHVLERAAILREPGGEATRLVGLLMDITARKQLQDHLCRSQKMEAFGQLAGGVAHDFNNFLTTILGYSDLLLHEYQLKSQIAEHIGEIRAAAGRASALTQQLLAFSRKQPFEPLVVEVNSIVTNLERSLLRLIGENISVVCHLHQEKSGAHIKADPGQVTQIILNLAVNARDAMPNGGKLTIETGTIELPRHPQCAIDCTECDPGQYVFIAVADNGTGMSEEAKAHLFEPFFTTKNERDRSGLGLATCYGIVHQSRGHLQVETEQGIGTTVRIYLPRVPAPPPLPYKKPASKKLKGGKETILVLEDDVSVRHISVRVLRALGYDVLEAANSADAQRLLEENNSRKIDLLLTDMVMPEMSGRRFADWLRSAHPAIKVLFASGYLEESLAPGDRCGADMSFLPKPFDPEQLAAKVRETLDTQ